MDTIVAELRALADPAYRAFQSALIPTVDPERVIGVRTPDLRAFAKRLARDRREVAAAFMAELPHTYYEENNLHVELLNLMPARTDYDQLFQQLDAFLPYVDNWATCDTLAPKALSRHPERTLDQVRERWLPSGATYTVRFGIDALMRWFLDENFDPAHLRLVADLPCGDYYIDMARAWYFSMALVKQWDETIGLFEPHTTAADAATCGATGSSGALDPWTHNKALQKARESRRITPERKAYLQGLKVRVSAAAHPQVLLAPRPTRTLRSE